MKDLSIAVLLCLFVASFAVIRPSRFEGHLNEGLIRRGLKNRGEFTDAGEQWFTQKLDQFDNLDTKTWQQRYYVNDSFYKPGSGAPVFFMIGGEGPLSDSSVTDHFVVGLYAKNFSALVVSLEHRYYGKSIPTPDTSTENMKYLSSRQALADLANFRDFIVEKYNAESSKWVVFGGSYPGCLSAWAREKYAHLFDISVASSGPVLAQLDFPEYFETVNDVIGDKCSSALRTATAQLETMLDTSSGRSKLSSMFKTCIPLDTDVNNQIMFLSALTDPIAGIVQYNLDNVPYQPMNVTTMCNMIMGTDPLSNWANLVQVYNEFEGATCTDISYSNFIEEMQETSAARSWVFQTCTEFGFYQSASSSKQPFSSRISLEWYVQQCQDIYKTSGPLKPDIENTNRYYGARNIKSTKTVFVNGSHDPWHTLGVLTSLSADDPAIFIPGTAHCADLYPPKEVGEIPALRKARDLEWSYVAKWLNE
eukprot:TRINITY_DN472_c0_g1_i1.p1 TRINITY_DN472_c0_g1~~TRINITY_DN472_c0_g1_i1.p1  ORF type:complete len:505 (+),score=103.36 TRINITY_DN472_c0_g1_i1:82-1515(+)